MCIGNQHVWMWGATTATDQTPLSLRCMCGALTREQGIAAVMPPPVSGAGERWRIGKSYPSLGGRLAEVREGGPEGGSRFVCEATPEDAETIVVAVNAILSDDVAATNLAYLDEKAENATLSYRLAESSARVRELEEIAAGMAACVEALDTNQAWYSRSHIALTLRDALRAWADKYAALRGAEGHTAERP